MTTEEESMRTYMNKYKHLYDIFDRLRKNNEQEKMKEITDLVKKEIIRDTGKKVLLLTDDINTFDNFRVILGD